MVNKITIWKVLEPLLYKQESMHLADISRALKSPHPTVRKYLNELERKGIVTRQIKGRLTLYKMNYSNPLTLDYFIAAEKDRLIEKGEKSLLMKEIISFFHENAQEALIFGSAVEDVKSANDIDVIVIGKIDNEKAKKFEKRLVIKLHMLNLASLGDVRPALKAEIIDKHLIIEGSEKIVRWMLKS